MTPNQIVDYLKTNGKYFAAGAAAYALDLGRRYGCHVGLKSERNFAIDTFHDGYDAAQRNAGKS